MKDRIVAKMKDELEVNKDAFKKEKCNLSLNGFTLSGELSWQSNGTIFMDVAASSKDDDSKFLKMYLSTLAYWAGQNSEEQQKITLLLFKDDVKASVGRRYVDMENSNQAKRLLNSIFNAAYSPYHYEIPINLLKEDNLDFHSYCEKFTDGHGPWAYFEHKDLFDIQDVCGFTEDNFVAEWETAKEEIKKLVILKGNQHE